MLKYGLTNELIKLKHSGIFWLATAGTLVTNLIFVVITIVLNRIETDLIQNNMTDSWANWVDFHYQGILPMLLPMFLVILCALTFNQEKRYGTWKVLAILPIHPRLIFLSKLIMITLIFTVSHFIFVVLLILLPFLFQFPFVGEAFMFNDILQLFSATILTSLGTIALVYMISYFSQSFVLPLAVGIIGFVISQLLHDHQVLAWYFPFSLPIEGMYQINTSDDFPLNFSAISLSFFALFTLIGYRYSATFYPRE